MFLLEKIINGKFYFFFFFYFVFVGREGKKHALLYQLIPSGHNYWVGVRFNDVHMYTVGTQLMILLYKIVLGSGEWVLSRLVVSNSVSNSVQRYGM